LFQRRSEDVTLLVREAFLRGISHAPGRPCHRQPAARSAQRADRFPPLAQSGFHGPSLSSVPARR
jgi:hypothetical protein